jgi:hypothetical protein
LEDNKNQFKSLLEIMPEKAYFHFFRAAIQEGTKSRFQKIISGVTVFLTNVLMWFILGGCITGMIWVLTYLFTAIKALF